MKASLPSGTYSAPARARARHRRAPQAARLNSRERWRLSFPGENLALTPAQRLARLQEMVDFHEQLRSARKVDE